MIVNCFPVFKAIRVTYNPGVSYVDGPSIQRVSRAIAYTYELTDIQEVDVFIALVQGGTGNLTDPQFTPAVGRLIDTLISWWSAKIGDDFEDAWGMKTRCTQNFVFENHNRAIGVMLSRALRIRKDSKVKASSFPAIERLLEEMGPDCSELETLKPKKQMSDGSLTNEFWLQWPYGK